MERLPNIHFGEVLQEQEEFLKEFNFTACLLAQDLHIPQTQEAEMLKGRRRITAGTALRLSRCFGNSLKFWLGLQNDCDVEVEQLANGAALEGIRQFTGAAA